jgi:hypothetical protein
MNNNKYSWISIKDRLPDDHQTVLVVNNLWSTSETYTALYRKKCKLFISHEYNSDSARAYPLNVTHWMPIDYAPSPNILDRYL